MISNVLLKPLVVDCEEFKRDLKALAKCLEGRRIFREMKFLGIDELCGIVGILHNPRNCITVQSVDKLLKWWKNHMFTSFFSYLNSNTEGGEPEASVEQGTHRGQAFGHRLERGWKLWSGQTYFKIRT